MTTSLRPQLYSFLTEAKTTPAKLVQVVITLLTLGSIGLFGLEIGYESTFLQYHDLFYAIELAIVMIFSVEYVLKLWSAPNRLKFIFSFYGLIDLLAILPFYLHLANLSFLRSARLLRLLRITKLFRLAKIMQYIQIQLGLPTISVGRVIQENVVKNIVVIVAIYYSAHYVEEFFKDIDLAVLPDLLLATSVLAVAAMFGFFSLSYADLNISKPFDRFLIHLTTAMLMFPIGMMFLIVQMALRIELGRQPVFLDVTIWLVYAAIVLWDFWNVHRCKNSAA